MRKLGSRKLEREVLAMVATCRRWWAASGEQAWSQQTYGTTKVKGSSSDRMYMITDGNLKLYKEINSTGSGKNKGTYKILFFSHS